MSALGLTTVRSLVTCWAVSAVVIVVGLMLVLTSTAVGPGLVLFALGALGSLVTAFFMLRLRAGDAANRPRRTPE